MKACRTGMYYFHREENTGRLRTEGTKRADKRIQIKPRTRKRVLGWGTHTHTHTNNTHTHKHTHNTHTHTPHTPRPALYIYIYIHWPQAYTTEPHTQVVGGGWRDGMGPSRVTKRHPRSRTKSKWGAPEDQGCFPSNLQQTSSTKGKRRQISIKTARHQESRGYSAPPPRKWGPCFENGSKEAREIEDTGRGLGHHLVAYPPRSVSSREVVANLLEVATTCMDDHRRGRGRETESRTGKVILVGDGRRGNGERE